MRSNLARLLKDIDIFRRECRRFFRGSVRLDQVGEVERTSQASRARADDQHVGFELFAFDGHGVILSEQKMENRKRKMERCEFLGVELVLKWRSCTEKKG